MMDGLTAKESDAILSDLPAVKCVVMEQRTELRILHVADCPGSESCPARRRIKLEVTCLDELKTWAAGKTQQEIDAYLNSLPDPDYRCLKLWAKTMLDHDDQINA